MVIEAGILLLGEWASIKALDAIAQKIGRRELTDHFNAALKAWMNTDVPNHLRFHEQT